ncbi:MAG TPA: hypothetical protein VNY10_15715 [Roseiarcus sp.]|jgi:hypothetical protein|nr:hypothetical protein [Roseiarcus sp.]
MLRLRPSRRAAWQDDPHPGVLASGESGRTREFPRDHHGRLGETERHEVSRPAHQKGARVEIAFSANGFTVDEPVQSVVWRGEPAYCQFLATIPAGTSGQSFFPVIRVSVDGKLVGPIKFRLSSDDTASQPTSEPLGDHAGRYRYAFVSYASKDREEVLKRVQMLEILKTKFF